MPQQQFKGYSQDQMKRIASKLGHTGDLNTFNNYLDTNPKALGKYNQLKDAAVKRYAKGGVVKRYAKGGAVGTARMYVDAKSYLARKATENQDMVDYLKRELASGTLDPSNLERAKHKLTGYEAIVAGNNAAIAAGLTGNAALKAAGVSKADIEKYGTKTADIEEYGTNTPDNPKYQSTGTATTTTGTDVGGDVQKLFQQHLGRAAGSEGADYYATKYQTMLDANIDPATAMSAIGGELQNSTEGKQRAAAVAAGNVDFQRYVAPSAQVATGVDYNTTTESIDALGRTGDNTAADAAAIQQVYQNQLGRAAGTKGADYYADLMAGGTNLDTVRGQVAGSPEAGTYNTTGQQQYVAPANRIDGVKYNETGTGNVGTPPPVDGTPPPADGAKVPTMLEKDAIARRYRPELPTGATLSATDIDFSDNQLIGSTKGQVDNTTLDPATGLGLPVAKAGSATAGSATAVGTTDVSGAQQTKGTTDATTDIKTAQAALTGETGTINSDNKVNAAQETTSAVTALTAAQELNATKVNGAPTRLYDKPNEEVQAVANAQTAAAFTEQIQAASADPSLKATVQGQLATLMTSFDNGNTPAWAAGAMRGVTATMAARGIGSSSMAGQALIQAALESALPIATADAQTFASFEVTNLNNRQQRAMLSAQQRATFIGQEFDQEFQERVFNSTRIGEIANMNFTATQAIALENAQLANTVNLTNLSNRQAKVMAEAASLSQLDIANLNNRQQEEVQNAQAFLEMDMANLTNDQQTSMFKAQSRVTAILSDTAAENARKQFNATSDNQMEQFYQQLSSQVSQFNASQKTAVSQSNAGDETAISKFNAEVKNQRDQFNAANSLVINQSNAQWRREIASAENVTINRVNEINAKALLDISNTAYNNLWQEHRDEMDWAYQQSEASLDRYSNLAISKLQSETTLQAAQIQADAETSASIGDSVGRLLTGSLTGTVLGEVVGIG